MESLNFVDGKLLDSSGQPFESMDNGIRIIAITANEARMIARSLGMGRSAEWKSAHRERYTTTGTKKTVVDEMKAATHDVQSKEYSQLETEFKEKLPVKHVPQAPKFEFEN